MAEVRRTFCRFCHANCAMVATIEQGKVVRVAGDPDDPVFGGYTCIKGRQLPDAHHGPQRLVSSRRREGDHFVDIGTEAALDAIGAQLKAIVAQHGPHAGAVYGGTYAFQNSAGVGSMLAFAQGLGTRNVYTSVTLDQPAKVYTALQYGHWEGGMHSFADADVAFFIGNNPIVSHYGPPGGLPPFSPSRRLRDALDRGLQLIVADPRTSDVAKLAHVHLPVRPGEDPALLAGIVHVILAERLYDLAFVQAHVDGLDGLARAVAPFDPVNAAARAGVDRDALVAAARMFAGGRKGVVSTGTGPEMAGQGTLTQYLVSALNIICGRFCREGEPSSIPRVFTPHSPRRAQVAAPMRPWGEGFPASRFRGLTHLGAEMPCNVLADEMLEPGEGQVRALICIGGNPVVAFPDQHKMVRALEGLDLLVSVDVREASETAKRSDYILAPKMCLEREDISNLSEWWYEIPYARYTEPVIAAPGDLQDEWELLWGLARRIGTGMPLAGGPCPMDVRPTKAAFLDLMVAGSPAVPSQVRRDTVDHAAVIYPQMQPVVEPADPASAARFDLAAGAMPARLGAYASTDPAAAGFALRLVSRRSRHRFNSTGHALPALRDKRSTNPAFMNPADMAQVPCRDGDVVRIRSKVGEVLAVARAEPGLRPGVVSMAHGFGGPDVTAADVGERGGSTNRLVSETVDYDPVTGQSLQSAIPIAITRI
jgi:anaerobic selenocysteine-containing dehydrogenase